MKLNHMICPNCGHDFYTDVQIARKSEMFCDLCRCSFWAGESRTCELSLWRRKQATGPHVGYVQFSHAQPESLCHPPLVTEPTG